jgi:hypothetical protein
MKKRIDLIKQNNGEEMKSGKTSWYLKALFVAFVISLALPMAAMASRERYVIDFNDSHIRGYQGEAATIFLKKSLKAQYPWVRIADLELEKVVLMAKSKKGRGGAGLRVGNWTTDMYRVAGDPQRFHNSGKHTFDRVRFWNPSKNSKGPWQIELKGNFIVRKIVLVVNDHNQRNYYGRWDRHRR